MGRLAGPSCAHSTPRYAHAKCIVTHMWVAAMSRASSQARDDTFNFRVDPALKADFQAATRAQHRPAAQVIRDFMRDYVQRQRHRDFLAEADRQSRAIAELAADPDSDEAQVLRELGDAFDALYQSDE